MHPRPGWPTNIGACIIHEDQLHALKLLRPATLNAVVFSRCCEPRLLRLDQRDLPGRDAIRNWVRIKVNIEDADRNAIHEL